MQIRVKKDGQWLYPTLGIVQEVKGNSVVLSVQSKDVTVPVTSITALTVDEMIKGQGVVMLPIDLETQTLLLEDIEVDCQTTNE